MLPDEVAVQKIISLKLEIQTSANPRTSYNINCSQDDVSVGLAVYYIFLSVIKSGSCHKRQKPQAPTPQAPIRNRQTRKVANAKGLNRNTNLT